MSQVEQLTGIESGSGGGGTRNTSGMVALREMLNIVIRYNRNAITVNSYGLVISILEGDTLLDHENRIEYVESFSNRLYNHITSLEQRVSQLGDSG